MQPSQRFYRHQQRFLLFHTLASGDTISIKYQKIVLDTFKNPPRLLQIFRKYCWLQQHFHIWPLQKNCISGEKREKISKSFELDGEWDAGPVLLPQLQDKPDAF